MTKYLILFGTLLTTFAAILLIKRQNNKKTKYAILISPFILAGLIYVAVASVTSILPSDACDGAALTGIFMAFIFLLMGAILNLINITNLAIARRQRK